MKFYKTIPEANYIYATRNPTENSIEFKEHYVHSGEVYNWKDIDIKFFLRKYSFKELTEQEFNAILLDAGMKEHMVATSLKSKIIRAF